MNDLYERLAADFGTSDPVLDVGTGSGAVAAELLARGVRLVLLDATDLRDRPVPRARYLLGDAGALPIRSGAVRGVLLSRVLHHLPDWRRGLAECARVLAPNGLLAVGAAGTTPDGPLGALVDAFYAATDAAGYRSLHGHEPSEPAEVDALLAELGCTAPELLVQTWTGADAPRALLAGRVASRYRWAPGQDTAGLPAIAERVLAASGLDPDTPLTGEYTGRYRLYRRIGATPGE